MATNHNFEHVQDIELRQAMYIIADTLNHVDPNWPSMGLLCTRNMSNAGLHENVVCFMGVLVRACLEDRVPLNDMADLCEPLFANALLRRASQFENGTLEHTVCRRYANLATQHRIRHGTLEEYSPETLTPAEALATMDHLFADNAQIIISLEAPVSEIPMAPNTEEYNLEPSMQMEFSDLEWYAGEDDLYADARPILNPTWTFQ